MDFVPLHTTLNKLSRNSVFICTIKFIVKLTTIVFKRNAVNAVILRTDLANREILSLL